MKRLLLLLACLLLAGSFILHAQNITISGTVTDANDGATLPGVSVNIKGTTIGVITDVDGKYSISVPPDAQFLTFTFVGMKTEEVAITGLTVVDIAMKLDVINLDEVIVVAYGITKKSSYTGSAKKISSEKIISGNTESIDKALAGKIAGVRISETTGSPGASGEIQIRGIGSINASTQPLYVIDGVAVTSGNYGMTDFSSNILSTLSPNDIENITVLKDAAAASLYGSRAANGVIIITTKKGQSGKTKFTFEVKRGWSVLGSDSYEMMSGPEYVKYLKKSLEGFFLYYSDALLPTDANYGDATINAEARSFGNNYAYDWFGTTSADWVYDTLGNTNWRDVIYKTGKSQEYLLSVTGGNDNTKFFTSFSYLNNDGIVLGSSFDRYTGRLNLDNKSNNWLSFGINQALSATNQKGYSDQSNQLQGVGSASPLGIMMEQDPTAPHILPNGEVNKNSTFPYDETSPYPDEVFGNDLEFSTMKSIRSMTNGYIQLDLFKGLYIKSTLGVDYLQNQSFLFWSPVTNDGESLNGYGYKYNNNQLVLTSSTVANYSKVFLEKHTLAILAGFETEKAKLWVDEFAAYNYSSSTLPELGNGQPLIASGDKLGTALLSYLGRLDYNYDLKYYLSGSLRTDGSSRLGKDNRYATFWSVSAAWKIKQEAFLRNISLLSDLRLRASYGTNGTLPSTEYGHMNLYSLSGGYGTSPAIHLLQPENKNLGWEKSANLNIGVDVGFYDRLGITVEYFYRITKDLLLDKPASYLCGYGDDYGANGDDYGIIVQNTGEISNKGLEIELNSINIVTNDVKWTTDFTFSTLKSTVEKLPNHEDIIAGDGSLYMYREGGSMYSFYLPKFYRVDPDCGLAQFYINPDTLPVDDNLTYYQSQAARTIVAKAIPDIMGGLRNDLSYKDFSIYCLFTYQFGGNLFDYPGYFLHHDGLRISTFNLAKDVEGNYWENPGDIVDNPRPVYGNPLRPDRWSTRFIKSTDHIRLKELGASYSIPKNLVQKLHVSNVSLNFKATNIAFVWRKVKGLDPEVPLNGYRTVDTPPARTYMFGLSCEF
jgi:TonB-linked SusC/RagA family outer membrane protein